MHLRKRADTIALPISVKPSGDWDGNDGRWSSFVINVNADGSGPTGQDFKVLISTSSSLIVLPDKSGWCNLSCAQRRGVLTYGGKEVEGVQTSTNWKDAGQYQLPLPWWYSDNIATSTNSTPAGAWGITNVGLGHTSAQSLVVPETYAVKYTESDFFMGSFGLAAGQVNGQGGPKATFLSQLRAYEQIASPTYGYTAGAIYRKLSPRSLSEWSYKIRARDRCEF